ncbi:MAG TPA: OB-fold nucleic acid binding domain-containing protein, partial [Tahibacter sp.]|nr:OB-fold nucleic acid binding domain-containing protein [Tahibacter sp.]
MSTQAGLQPLTGLPGVGPALRETLARLGMTVLQDLWFHLPLRYEDRTRLVPIADLREGESAQVEGVVDAVQRGFRGRPQLRVALSDGSQETLVLRFFHFRGAQADQLKPGARLRCYGEVRRGQNSLEMVHPQYQRLSDDAPAAVEETLTPVYPITEGLGQRRLGTLIQQALQRLPDDDALELIPDSLRAGLELGSLREALLFVHRPPPDANVAQLLAGVHPAQQRLAFEELLSHHLSLKQLRNSVRRQA